MEIGKKIQQRRIFLGLTQQELANRCELSKGFISQLENDKTSPSIETLNLILEVLGIKISDFFASDQKKQIIFTKDDYFEKDFGNYRQLWLVPSAQINQMEPIIVLIKKGSKTILDMPHNGEEFGFVINGEILIHYGDEAYKCKCGESFYFETNKKHYIENIGEEETKIIWVSCPPEF